jgi:hypothetical protein
MASSISEFINVKETTFPGRHTDGAFDGKLVGSSLGRELGVLEGVFTGGSDGEPLG